jgi:hypothetical protein
MNLKKNWKEISHSKKVPEGMHSMHPPGIIKRESQYVVSKRKSKTPRIIFKEEENATSKCMD